MKKIFDFDKQLNESLKDPEYKKIFDAELARLEAENERLNLLEKKRAMRSRRAKMLKYNPQPAPQKRSSSKIKIHYGTQPIRHVAHIGFRLDNFSKSINVNKTIDGLIKPFEVIS